VTVCGHFFLSFAALISPRYQLLARRCAPNSVLAADVILLRPMSVLESGKRSASNRSKAGSLPLLETVSWFLGQERRNPSEERLRRFLEIGKPSERVGEVTKYGRRKAAATHVSVVQLCVAAVLGFQLVARYSQRELISSLE
jgi:hypothetical protein